MFFGSSSSVAQRSPAVIPLLMIAAAAIGSGAFACVTPFPAFALAAAFLLQPRTALVTVVAVWLANQAVGFTFLNYPWDASTMLWGVAIGIAAVLALLAGQAALRRVPGHVLRALAASGIVAFAAYEIALLLVALVLGGTASFTPSIIGEFALLNTAWAAGLIGVAEALQLAGVLELRQGTISPA
ncbi:MAG TPA: hypothetical protein VHY35_05715 [Stellaceae bacterium]|jgi:hypothetical protein|nr:hypothetical protein [Stellaceae bacterium]